MVLLKGGTILRGYCSQRYTVVNKIKVEDDQNQSVGTQEVPYFYEENGPNLTFPEEASDYYESVLRINEAYDSASGKPFAKENLQKATNWLHFQGLVVSELVSGNKPTLAQQIVQYLKNEADHGFRLVHLTEILLSQKGYFYLLPLLIFIRSELSFFLHGKNQLKFQV